MKALNKFLAIALTLVLMSGPVFSNLLYAVFAFGAASAVITAAFVPAEYLSIGHLNVGGLDLEIWKKYIIERLLKDNQFLVKSKDDSGYVLGGAVVHIPQAGAKPVVVKNRNSFPATTVRRTDTDIYYLLDNYTTDPTHMTWAELQTLSYDKIDSVLGDHMNTLSETVADDILIKWNPPAANKVLTTGGPDAGTVAGVGAQTGTRKGLHHKDLKKVMIAMNVMKIPKTGRVVLIDDNMYEFFYDSLTDSMMNAFQQFADNKSGIVGRLHGFDIMTRTSVLAWDNADAVKALGAAGAATDNLVSLAWHPSVVCRAIGETKPFQKKDDPQYYGDVYSMAVRAGGRIERGDNVGIVPIVQAA